LRTSATAARPAATAAIWRAAPWWRWGDEKTPKELRSAFVTANFFQVLGVDTVFGRLFRPDSAEERRRRSPELGSVSAPFGAVLHRQQILVNDQLTTVIGVMPHDFRC
jgi:hypothetical protein